MATKWGWGESKRQNLTGVLARFPTIDINNPAIINAYAAICAWTEGKPVSSMPTIVPPKPAKRMGKNDLWIAATAHAIGATLLSTDDDFSHLADHWFKFTKINQGHP